MIITDSRASLIVLAGLVCILAWGVFSLYRRSLRPDRAWRCLVDVRMDSMVLDTDGSPHGPHGPQHEVLRVVRESIRSIGVEHSCECRGFVVNGFPGFPKKRAVQLWVAAPNKEHAAVIVSAVVSEATKNSSATHTITPRVYSANDVDEYIIRARS